jgi:hypothetical protein
VAAKAAVEEIGHEEKTFEYVKGRGNGALHCDRELRLRQRGAGAEWRPRAVGELIGRISVGLLFWSVILDGVFIGTLELRVGVLLRFDVELFVGVLLGIDPGLLIRVVHTELRGPGMWLRRLRGKLRQLLGRSDVLVGGDLLFHLCADGEFMFGERRLLRLSAK